MAGTGSSRAGRRALLALALLASIPAGTAHSSPIRHHRLSIRATNQLQAWSQFLAGGPALWERVGDPTITARIRTTMGLALRGPDPISDPNVEYLMWRRSLNPARFDYWHPQMGPRLQALLPEVIGPNPVPSPAPEPAQDVPSSPPPDATTSSPLGTTPPPDATTPTPGSASPPVVEVPPSAPSPSPEPIPEPETWLMGVVMLGSGLWWRRRNRRSSRTH